MEIKTMLLMVFCALAGIAFFIFSCSAQNMHCRELNRGDYLKGIEESHKNFQENTSSNRTRIAYARRLFEVGEFSKSQELLKPLLNTGNPPPDASYLSAHIEYLNGHYNEAENIFKSLLKKSQSKLAIDAQIGLVGVYYQTNQYQMVQTLFKGSEGKITLALWDMMKAFGNDKPYQIEWNGNNRITIPFIVSNPLPVISIKINGKTVNVIIDTGAEILYLDEKIAASLGIKPVTRQVEPYAGGKTIEVGYGRAETLTIGEISLKHVPIKLGPIQRISAIYDNKLTISGILATGVLQQFLSTIDYPESRLILRTRNKENENGLKNEFARDKMIEVPFVLDMTHLMICKGTINNKDALNLLVDSGLADSLAALCLPKQTLDYLNIPVPVAEPVADKIGGLAGGGFPIGRFAIGNAGLGALRQDDLTGLYGVFPPQLYHGCEFIIDGMISHQFLKKYKWTIDFDSMRMIFCQ